MFSIDVLNQMRVSTDFRRGEEIVCVFDSMDCLVVCCCVCVRVGIFSIACADDGATFFQNVD